DERAAARAVRGYGAAQKELSPFAPRKGVLSRSERRHRSGFKTRWGRRLACPTAGRRDACPTVESALPCRNPPGRWDRRPAGPGKRGTGGTPVPPREQDFDRAKLLLSGTVLLPSSYGTRS